MAANPSSVISRELEAGESLLWSGQPRQGFVLRGTDAFLIPFSLLWGGFAIFWEMAVLAQARKHGHTVPAFFVFWGIPFVLVGLYLIVGRFIVDALQRKNTYYGLTDRRVIIVTGMFDRKPSLDLATVLSFFIGLGRAKVKSLDLRTLTDVTVSERSDDTGTITFGPQNPFSIFANSSWPGMASRSASPCFELIAHARSVYQQVRSAQRKAS